MDDVRDALKELLKISREADKDADRLRAISQYSKLKGWTEADSSSFSERSDEELEDFILSVVIPTLQEYHVDLHLTQDHREPAPTA